MFLVLEITSSNAAVLGAASRAVFSVKGGTIGRRAGNDWVLPDPHVSSRHARVRSVGGTFFLEDTESANGVTVNGSKLHPGEPFPLKEGDSIFIDPFEITVRISVTMPGAQTQVQPKAPPSQSEIAVPAATPPARDLPSVDDLLGNTPPPVQPPAMQRPADVSGGGLADLLGADGGSIPSDFNPLLDSPAARPPAAPRPSGQDLLGKPVIGDAMNIPPPAPRAPPAGGGIIPTNWEGDDEPVKPGVGPGGPGIIPRPPPPPGASVAHAAPTPPGVGGEFAELLRGAGLQEQALSPEVLAQLGQVLRVVVDGLMVVLRARGEIKSEFRLQQTTFKPRENNPLKFSANVEDALHNLLVKRNPAYLDTPAAFEDAFADVRSHQLAMLAGMRAAFEYMLGRFDPQALRAQFDAKPGRKVSLGFGAAGRYWESFEEYYKELTSDADDCFRRLFGDQFARSYEEQLKQLRASGRPMDPQG